MGFNYDTWGNSWLASWGNSWGVRTPSPTTTRAPTYSLPSATNTFSIGFGAGVAVGGPEHLRRLYGDRPPPVQQKSRRELLEAFRRIEAQRDARARAAVEAARKKRKRALAMLLLLDD